ncbi:MAG: DNA polymerase IV [bacterium]
MQRERYIIHADMDAFFAAVEQRDNPKYQGKPVIVGSDPKGGRGRGVVATCSYEARAFGIGSAMPISIAYKKCPEAIFLRPDFEKYAQASDEIYEIFNTFTPDVEPVGIDESFLDITASYHLFGSPRQVCVSIKERVKEKTGLRVSIGLAPTKMAAKIASDIGKPDGLVEVTSEALLDFLWPLDVGKIWGLGKKAQAELNSMGIYTIGDLAKRSLRELTSLFGKSASYLHNASRGIDEREVQTSREAKSLSNEVTFETDVCDKKKVEGVLLGLCEKVSGRLRREDLKGTTVTLKIRLDGFRTYTRSSTIAEATNFVDEIYTEVKRLYRDFSIGGKVRLVGVRVCNLSVGPAQGMLFSYHQDQKNEELHRALDKIKSKFGNASIYRLGVRGR